jgi:hypothetical protein
MVAESSALSAQRNCRPTPTTTSRISFLKVIITAPVGNLAEEEATMTQFDNPEVTTVARSLDTKLANLVKKAERSALVKFGWHWF